MGNGYWSEYSYVGIMPDGSEQEFVSADEYAEALESWEE